MSEAIINLYTEMLDAADLSVDQQGMVSVATPSGKNSPLTITGKRLVLPTKEHLSNPEWSGRIAFHPLVENIVGGESQVHERFRKCANSAINLRVSYIFLAMADLCQDKSKEKQQALPPECSQLMMSLANGDDQLYIRVKKILDKAPVFVHTNVQKGAEIAGKKYRVGCVSYFPIYDELVKGAKEIENVALRQRDVEVLKKIYQFIFPSIDQKQYYSAGSDSLFSPTVLAELLALDKIYTALNDVFVRYDAALKGSVFVKSLAWREKLDTLSDLKKQIDSIPMLDGNSGKVKKGGAPAGAAYVIPEAQAVTVRHSGVAPGSPVQLSQLPTLATQPAIHAPVQQQHTLVNPNVNQPIVTQQPMSTATFKKIGQSTSTTTQPSGLSSVASPMLTHQSMYGPSVPVQSLPPAVVATPMGYIPAQQLSLNQAQTLQEEQMRMQQAQAHAQMQQIQNAREQQVLVQAAQAAGIQVMALNNGTYGGALPGPDGQLTWQPLTLQNVPNAMQYMAMSGITPAAMMIAPGTPVMPMLPQPPANAAPMTPGGTVDFATMMAGNPALQANYLSDQMMRQQQMQLQQQQQMAQMYGGVMPGMQQMMGAPQANYVPGYMRAMQLPPGAVASIGRL